MKLFIYILILLSSVCHAQTRSIVPYADGQGSVGRTNKQWQAGYFENVIVNGTNLNTRISSNQVFTFNALTGSVELVAGDGVQIVTNGNQLTVGLLTTGFPIGTNRVYFLNSSNQISSPIYWVVPSGYSNISAWLWGGAGTQSRGVSQNGGGYGGFAFVQFRVTPLSTITVVVGQGGLLQLGTNATGLTLGRVSFPNGGRGVVRNSSGGNDSGAAGSGAGRSQILINTTNIYDETNTIAVAGGGGSCGYSGTAGYGGSGGGISGGDASTGQNNQGGGGTQSAGGSTGTATLSLLWTNRAGGKFFGGDAGVQTNGSYAGAGGDGWFGGGGGVGNGGSAGNAPAGGGGSGYINMNLAVGGVTTRGLPQANSSVSSRVIGNELPEYITGAGVPATGNVSGSGGLIVIGY